MDVVTPPLDGTILPGITRISTLALLQAHTSGAAPLPGLAPSQRIHTYERAITMADMLSWSASGALLEAFGVGTAVIVAPIGRIGFEGKDLVLPKHDGGLGGVGRALWQRIVDIQEGRFEWEGWSVACE